MSLQQNPQKLAPVSVAIIGSGVSGMVAAIQIQRQLGITDFVIIEKSRSGWGGTWNKNTYPGAACDVLGHVYCFSFALNPNWTKKWPSQPEIQAYFERVAHENSLPQRALFGTEVLSGVWNDRDLRWTLTLRTHDHREFNLVAKAVISGVGQLNIPAYPNIPGLNAFKGPVVHSAEWDHSLQYDGRIAVVGTGASAIQFVPELAKTAKRMWVYQRSPAYMLPRGNFKYSELFKWTCRNVPYFMRIYRFLWFLALDRNFIALKTWVPFISRLSTLYCKYLVWSAVKQRSLLPKVMPTYPLGCKRLLISDDWYPTLELPHVDLVTDPIVRIESDGVVVRDKEGKEEKHVVDTVVLGTGFKATGFLEPMEFVGRGGVSLRKRWADGAEAYQGYAVADFPNLFVLYGPNTNLGHNSIIAMIESTMQSILHCLRDLLDPTHPTPYIAVKRSVQDVYNAKVQRELEGTSFTADCASWYREKSGKITTQWSGFVVSYWAMTREIKVDDFEQPGLKPFWNARRRQRRTKAVVGGAAGVVAAAGGAVAYVLANSA
ncbi:hypothetical protein HDU96_002682 [Phlyctochytrium bullatum]|nr:hypothetical protein HDU96_002682 [Phlyctochytrium bullatum]